MTPDEKLAALGLADVDLIPRKEFDALPEHRRLTLGPLPGGGYAYLRLPDPPPVAALRRILELSVDSVADDAKPENVLAAIYGEARTALAEFDGTTT